MKYYLFSIKEKGKEKFYIRPSDEDIPVSYRGTVRALGFLDIEQVQWLAQDINAIIEDQK